MSPNCSDFKAFMALAQFPCIVSTADTDTEKSGLCATETAIILAGQQWIAAGQHYLQLTRGLASCLPADACWPTVW